MSPTILSEKASNWVDRGEDEQHACDSSDVRIRAIALWHVAKAALVRDFAERVLRGDVPANEPTSDGLGHWLATRLLSPDELARFEREGIRTEKDD